MNTMHILRQIRLELPLPGTIKKIYIYIYISFTSFIIWHRNIIGQSIMFATTFFLIDDKKRKDNGAQMKQNETKRVLLRV